ncbi:MAG: riboflavin synthase [Candidatus Pelagibacterales bacterium]|jgi:riboflavin synthase|tara:strand:+ start:434 stop:1024 length:591 start_codon:yes stop_codon:yes gene_type:complete
MFSGIIENKGFVFKFEKQKDFRLVLDTNLKYKDIKKGSSVCCNGICLTVISKKKKKKYTQLSFDVSQETINCSNFNVIKKGDEINIEKSLRVGDEISGHFVFGHVDDTSKLISIKKVGDSHEIKLEISKKIKKFIAKKGSVSLNGISLTVNQVKNNFIVLNIIPFTWLNTNLKGLKIGDRINLEVDMLARYVTQNQ